jgi:vesicle-fusing ATPase
MLKILEVIRLPDTSFGFENVLLHNKDDFGERDDIYVKIDNTIYRSISNEIEKGKIGLGAIHRNHHYFELGKKIKVMELKSFERDENFTNKLVIKIARYKKKSSDNSIIIIPDEFIAYLNKRFANFFFCENQKHIYDFLGDRYLSGHVSDGCGFIGPDTEISLVTDDVNLNIVEASMNKELFKKDFNFEEIGIGGLDDTLANILRRGLSSRAINPELIEKMGLSHVKGMILFGPPGTGKTLIARNIGKLLTTTNEPTIINGPEILNKFVGQSEENMRNIFLPARTDFAQNGIRAQLHVYIFDEIDAICKKRGRSGTQSGVNDNLVNQLLTIMDGVDSLPNIFIIAMTNRIELLDDALLRPGRFEVKMRIGLPNKNGRKQILRIHTNKMRDNSMMDPIDLDKFSDMMENFSGAEIESVVKNASSFAINEVLMLETKDIKCEDILVTNNHFMQSLNEIKPAFGNNKRNIEKLLPRNFVELKGEHMETFYKLMEITKNENRLDRILIKGPKKVGKTTLISKLALDSDIKFVKLIRPVDVVRKDEFNKSEFLIDTMMDAHISLTSLIIIDDIEIIMNFVDLGYNLSFSNKLYQTMITMLKTVPEEVNNCANIICTTSCDRLCDLVKDYFDEIIELE